MITLAAAWIIKIGMSHNCTVPVGLFFVTGICADIICVAIIASAI